MAAASSGSGRRKDRNGTSAKGSASVSTDRLELEKRLREKRDRLLVARFCSVFWLVILGLALYAVPDLRLDSETRWLLYSVKLVGVAVLVAVRLAFRSPACRPRAVPFSVLWVSSLYVVATVSAVVRQETVSEPLVVIGLLVASAAVLPWGVRAQLATVVIAAACLTWLSLAVSSGNSLGAAYPVVAMVIGGFASVYVAYELQRQRRAAEEHGFALHASEERYRLLAENATDILFRLAPDGEILDVSPACRLSLGYAPDELIGRRARDLMHPDDIPGMRDAIGDILESGMIRTHTFRVAHKDGHFVRIETTSRRLPPSESGAPEILSVARDVTKRHQAEEGLRHSEAHFRSLIESSLDMVTIVEADGTIRYQSPGVERILGYAPDALLGRDALDLIHPDDRERIVSRLAAARESPDPAALLEFRARHGDGAWRTVEARGARLPDADGTARVVVNSRDITERKGAEEALRESETRYRLVALATNDAIWDWHLSSGRVVWNDAVQTLFGYRADEVNDGVDWWRERIHREDRDRVLASVEAAIGTSVNQWSGEYRFRRGDGSYADVVDRGYVVRDAADVPVRMIGAMTEVTERKRADADLRAAKEAAEAASRAKSEFVTNISHEIRTPMNGIIGMTELALDTNLSDEQREYLTLVKSSADALLGVINDILDFAKMEAGKLDLDAVDFRPRDVLDDTIDALGVRARAKGLRLECRVAPQVPDTLVGDPGRLRQVLTNLVGNAIKFTQRGSIAVSVGAEVGGDAVELSCAVSDSGIGVPREKQDRIFEAFEQAESSTSRRYGGTGLGLPISARLVHLMNGRISVDSDPGRGSTFTFTARFRVHRGEESVAVPRELVYLRGLPVLVVGADGERERLESRLLGWHLRPVLASCGRDALAEMERASVAGAPFPLVLLDTELPDMPGMDLARQIAARPHLAGATLMTFSVAPDAVDAERARELGIAALLGKSVGDAELLSALRRLLGEPEPPASARSAVPRRTARGPCLCLLVAEDNAVNQKLITRILEKRGHEVVLAANGAEAVRSWSAQPFDAVFMDVQMPEMDGFEATAAIRARECSLGTHTPIIAMTAHAMKGDEERCLKAGMDAYVSKPIHTEKLFATLHSLVEANRAGVDTAPEGRPDEDAAART